MIEYADVGYRQITQLPYDQLYVYVYVTVTYSLAEY